LLWKWSQMYASDLTLARARARPTDDFFCAILICLAFDIFLIKKSSIVIFRTLAPSTRSVQRIDAIHAMHWCHALMPTTFCLRNMKMGKMPAQAIANDLELMPLPKELSNLCDLELQLLAQVIAFQKIVGLVSRIHNSLEAGKCHSICMDISIQKSSFDDCWFLSSAMSWNQHQHQHQRFLEFCCFRFPKSQDRAVARNQNWRRRLRVTSSPTWPFQHVRRAYVRCRSSRWLRGAPEWELTSSSSES